MKISKERKVQFLSKVYFGVSDNPKDDVNQFDNLEEFLSASIGELRWGSNLETRQRSKIRFSRNFSIVLASFSVNLSFEDIWISMNEDNKINTDVVNEWAELADFTN